MPRKREATTTRPVKAQPAKSSSPSRATARSVRQQGKSAMRLYAEKIRRELAANRNGNRTWTWAFLEVLACSGNVSLACWSAGTDRQNAYQLRDRDEEFRRQWEYALELAADLLEEEAWRRACDGVERYVVSQGKIVLGPDGRPLVERHYSDMLLDRLLRAHRPERFRDSYNVMNQLGPVVKIYSGFDPDKL